MAMSHVTPRQIKNRVIKGLRYINVNYGDPDFSPETLANALGVNLQQLGYYFSRHPELTGGLTPAQRISGLRAEKAKRLLSDHPQATLREVAEASGFGSYVTMWRAFEKWFDKLPSEFRANAQGRKGKAHARLDPLPEPEN